MRNKLLGIGLLFLLFLLAACGGGEQAVEVVVEEAPVEEAVSEEAEEITETIVETVVETVIETLIVPEEEVVEDPAAIGSEDGSGALPPPINSGSKVTATPSGQDEAGLVDILFVLELAEDTAVITTELEEIWDSIASQVEALPTQPQPRYATIIAQQNNTFQITSGDFNDQPPSLTTTIGEYQNATVFAQSLADEIAQLSWNDTDSLQIIFVIGTENLLDEVEVGDENTAVIYPITTQQNNPSTVSTPTPYQTIAEETTGYVIHLNNETTLSEQIILAIAQTISNANH